MDSDNTVEAGKFYRSRILLMYGINLSALQRIVDSGTVN